MSRVANNCCSIPVLSLKSHTARVNLPFRSPIVKSPLNDETCHTHTPVSDFSETPRSQLQSHSYADKTLNHLEVEQCRNIEKEIFDLDEVIHNLSQTYNDDELETHKSTPRLK